MLPYLQIGQNFHLRDVSMIKLDSLMLAEMKKFALILAVMADMQFLKRICKIKKIGIILLKP